MRELGVGLVWWPALASLFHDPACAVLELEPQALWEKVADADGGWRYRLNESLFEQVLSLPQRKLLHGVAQPVGGSVDDPLPYLPLLRRMSDALDPPWVSEHLSVNRFCIGGAVREAGFLLPPAQNEAGARVAAANIARYAAALARPFAFETGVNYLQPRGDELDDGAFFAMVAAQAHCGILLDLHNLWCNERNGRQPVREALARMPLDAVWEVHVAGGMPLDGYWLDAHSAVVPDALFELAAEVLPRLPNVGALVFEILPEHLPAVGLDAVERELDRLHGLWRSLPRRTVVRAGTRPAMPAREATAADIAATRCHELELWAALHDESAAAQGGSCDPGLAILRKLIDEFRRANLARTMRYSITALLAALGQHATRALLLDYFREQPADLFPAVEAEGFGRFLRTRPDVIAVVPYLDEVLAFECALIAATLHGESRDLDWSADPTAILGALDDGHLPRVVEGRRSAMRIVAA